MILEYISQVKKYLEKYHFQDEYKVLLELEEQLQTLQAKYNYLDYELIKQNFGTSKQYAQAIIEQYDLDASSEQTTLAFEDDLEQDIKLSSNESKTKNSSLKPIFKIIFIIISIIFTLLAIAITVCSLIISFLIFLSLDIQTAISFFLGIVLLLFAINLWLSLIKHSIYCLCDHTLRLNRLLITFLIAVLLTFFASQMLTSSLNMIGIMVSSNLSAIQAEVSQYNIDISTIDWNNLTLNEGAKFAREVISSIFNF